MRGAEPRNETFFTDDSLPCPGTPSGERIRWPCRFDESTLLARQQSSKDQTRKKNEKAVELCQLKKSAQLHRQISDHLTLGPHPFKSALAVQLVNKTSSLLERGSVIGRMQVEEINLLSLEGLQGFIKDRL